MLEIFMFNRVFLFFIFLVASPVVMASAEQSFDKKFVFTVYLDDDEFGTHQVRINEEGDQTKITTTARFVYRLLFVPVYRYEHTTTEIWRDNCVRTIESKTDDNGDALFVRGKLSSAGRFEVETKTGNKELDACVHTFAYWDIDKLRSQRLLNTQTGEYEQSTFQSLGMQELNTSGGTIRANKYRLKAGSGVIDLWYSGDKRWLALESVVDNGSIIRYISAALIRDETLNEDEDR